MARAKAILQSKYPYNISGRCINAEWFAVPMKQTWDIFQEELYLTSAIHNLRVHAFVLMSNHYHLIASTPDSNISECMRRLLKRTSDRLTEAGNRINGTFAGRHYKTVLHYPSAFLNAYKYVYRNPVTAGVCARVEDYPFSTLGGLLGANHLLVPVHEDATLFQDPEACLRWLNQKPEDASLDAVRWALKRPYFASKNNAVTDRPILGPHEIM